jgi:hypothetical protein
MEGNVRQLVRLPKLPFDNPSARARETDEPGRSAALKRDNERHQDRMRVQPRAVGERFLSGERARLVVSESEEERAPGAMFPGRKKVGNVVLYPIKSFFQSPRAMRRALGLAPLDQMDYRAPRGAFDGTRVPSQSLRRGIAVQRKDTLTIAPSSQLSYRSIIDSGGLHSAFRFAHIASW